MKGNSGIWRPSESSDHTAFFHMRDLPTLLHPEQEAGETNQATDQALTSSKAIQIQETNDILHSDEGSTTARLQRPGLVRDWVPNHAQWSRQVGMDVAGL